MFTLGELIKTCTNDWNKLVIYNKEKGFIGTYYNVDQVSEKLAISIVRNWNYQEGNVLYVLI